MSGGNTRPLVVEKKSDEELEQALEREPVFDWTEHISIDPNVAFGKPVGAGMRLTVEFLLDCFAGGWTVEQVLERCPHSSRDSLRAVFAYAADLAHERQQRPSWMTEQSSLDAVPR